MSYKDILDGLASVHESKSTNTSNDDSASYISKPLKVGSHSICTVHGSLEIKDGEHIITIRTENIKNLSAIVIKLPNSYIGVNKECSFLGHIKGNAKNGYSVSGKVDIYSPNYEDDSISGTGPYHFGLTFRNLSYKSETITVKGKTIQDVFMNSCKQVESYFQKNYLDVLKEYLPLDKAYKFINSKKFDKLYQKYKDKPINFDDTPIVVYKNDEIEYQGILDDCPYKKDDWKQFGFCRGIYYLYDENRAPGSLYLMINNE